MKCAPFETPIYVTRPVLPDPLLLQKQIQAIWESKILTNNGAFLIRLENRLKQFLKIPEILLFNNGTIALMVAVKCLGLEGDVITTPFTFPATAHALSWNNITPVFCDIDPDTLNINPELIESATTPRTTGIMPVHVFGRPCDIQAIQSVAQRHKLKIIYDAAHALGVEIDGTGIGNFGDISMFSFHATKLFHTAEGGALAFAPGEIKSHIELLRNFGIRDEDTVLVPGLNGKMNEIQAAIGLLVLDIIGDEIEKRKKLTTNYKTLLENIPGIAFPPLPDNATSNFQYLIVRINKEKFGLSRDDVYSQLKQHNVFSRKYFYPLCSNYPCYRNLPSAAPENLPEATRAAHEVLMLPLYGNLSSQDVARICEIILTLRKF